MKKLPNQSVGVFTDQSDLIKQSKKFISELEREKFLAVIAHYDLPKSTKQIIKNQDKTIPIMLLHNKICSEMIEANGGEVIKELGDAVLAIFSNFPLACECALNVIHNLKKYRNGICTKVTITWGRIEKVVTRSEPDIYGVAVNLCNRMAEHDEVDSILMEDYRFINDVEHWLPKDKKIIFSKAFEREVTDFGKMKLRTISIK